MSFPTNAACSPQFKDSIRASEPSIGKTYKRKQTVVQSQPTQTEQEIGLLLEKRLKALEGTSADLTTTFNSLKKIDEEYEVGKKIDRLLDETVMMAEKVNNDMPELQKKCDEFVVNLKAALSLLAQKKEQS